MSDAISQRGRFKAGAKVVVLDIGPFHGKRARIERPMDHSPGYWVRIEGQEDVRSAMNLERQT